MCYFVASTLKQPDTGCFVSSFLRVLTIMPSLFNRYLTTLGLLTAVSCSQVSANSTTSALPSFRYESLYSLLLAEIALVRNQAPLALKEYAQQAKETQDDGVTERALQIANYLQDSTIALPLATVGKP